MRMHHILISTAIAGLLMAYLPHTVEAITTSSGQTWDYVPDAWARDNNSNTSYFGWDMLEGGVTPDEDRDFLDLLDDTTPDLGIGITATGTRIYQGTDGIANPSPTAYGHVFNVVNDYYSFNDRSNDTITATAPASGSGGYTTVVLQVIGLDEVSDLSFGIENTVENTWILSKLLHGTNADGFDLYWKEWSTPGANPTFKIKMTSFAPHRGIDAFSIDTFWTSGGAPAINSLESIGVPEPASAFLASLGLVGLLMGRRRKG